MNDTKPTLGQAIDQIIGSLSSFEERDRRVILGVVCSHLGIEPTTRSISRQTPAATLVEQDVVADAKSEVRPNRREIESDLDIRTLKDEKKPNSARQMACLVAYYLQEHAPSAERKNVITVADIERYFKQAGFKLPTKLEQLLIDSKKSGYFESTKRGEYSLTRVGYNLVTHSMPARANS